MGCTPAIKQNLAAKRGTDAANKSLQDRHKESEVKCKPSTKANEPIRRVEDIDLDKWFKHFKDKTAEEAVLHTLKQLKAQIGKLQKKHTGLDVVQVAINDCMEIIDKKIAKIKK